MHGFVDSLLSLSFSLFFGGVCEARIGLNRHDRDLHAARMFYKIIMQSKKNFQTVYPDIAYRAFFLYLLSWDRSV